MKKFISLTFFASLFITACNPTEPVCKTDATSISGSYRITAATYKASPTSPEMDYMNILFPDACERDDVYTFQTNGTYQIKDAGSVCSPPNDYDGTWSMSGNNMIVDGDPTAIESFDCQTLVISNTDTQNTGDKLKLTLTKQ